jgi:hypothetical protein
MGNKLFPLSTPEKWNAFVHTDKQNGFISTKTKKLPTAVNSVLRIYP